MSLKYKILTVSGDSKRRELGVEVEKSVSAFIASGEVESVQGVTVTADFSAGGYGTALASILYNAKEKGKK